MSAPFILVLISGSVLCALVLFFRYEQAHNVRFARGIRSALDRGVAACTDRVVHRLLGGSRSFRQSLHYIFHQVLTRILSVIKRVETAIRFAVHFNKTRAKRADEARRPLSHLQSVAEHKREAQLTEEEKRTRRENALRG